MPSNVIDTFVEPGMILHVLFDSALHTVAVIAGQAWERWSVRCFWSERNDW